MIDLSHLGFTIGIDNTPLTTAKFIRVDGMYALIEVNGDRFNLSNSHEVKVL